MLAADFPAIITSSSIEIVDDVEVLLAWQSPDPNGSPLDAYKVEIQTSTESFVEETQFCSGALDPTIIDRASCRMPMSAFSEDPWNLAQGTVIVFRVTARN